MNHPIPTIILALALALTACQEKTAEPAATPPNIQPTQPPATQSASSVVADNNCLTRDKCSLTCPDGGKVFETPTETACKKDGKLHGLRLRWHTNGSRRQSQFFRYETAQFGFTTSWYENGQKSHEQSAKGTRDWYETGEKKAEFIGGKRYPKTQDGVMTKWFKNGNKKTVQHWKNWQEHGEFLFFYESGQKSIQSEYIKGKRNGVFTTWHENGQMSSKANYLNDKLDGAVTVWHPNGPKKSEAQYKEGQQLSQTCWDDKGQTIDCAKD